MALEKYGSRLARLTVVFGLVTMMMGGSASSDPPKTALDKSDPKKLPAALKPKGTPKEVLAVLGERDGRYDCLAFRPDGGELAVSGPDGKVRLWDMTSLKITGSTAHKDVVCLAYAPNGKTLAAADAQGNLKFWSIQAGRPMMATTAANAHKGGPIWAMSYSPDGQSLFTAGADKTVKIWDSTRTPPLLKFTLTGHEDRIRGLAVSHDGKILATTSDRDKTVRIWDLSDKPKELAKATLRSGALSVAISADDETLFAGCSDGSLLATKLGPKLGDPEAIRSGKGIVYTIALAPDGKSILGLVKWDPLEDRACIWDLEGKQRLETKFGMKIEAAAFDPGGRHLVLANESSLYILRLAE